MNCPNCNEIVDENEIICKNCGSSLSFIINNLSETNSQSLTPVSSAPVVPQNNVMAIASMVLGIASIPLLLYFSAGIIPGIIAVALGFTAKKKIAESNGAEKGRGMALAGIILGISAVIIAVIIVILVILGIAFFILFMKIFGDIIKAFGG